MAYRRLLDFLRGRRRGTPAKATSGRERQGEGEKERETRRLVERILEDESLTTDLVDPAAEILLDWGVERAKEAVQQSRDVDAHLGAIQRTMKRINRQAGESAPAEQPERVRTLLAEIEGANVETEHAE